MITNQVVISCFFVLALWTGRGADAAPEKEPAKEVGASAGFMHDPCVSRSHIVFVHGNDLWIVPREGGLAVPLTSGLGRKSFPKFSPDGQTIGFTGNFDGHDNLYTIPAAGGEVRRVTHHPDIHWLDGWTPDRKLIFSRFILKPEHSELFTVSCEGGLPSRLPVPYGCEGAISPDGQWLAYTPYYIHFYNWKDYRGGRAPDIWLFHLHAHTSKKITDWEGTDAVPMWHGNSIYYLSDAGPEHRRNIWVYDTKSGRRREVTHFQDYEVRRPSIGPGRRGQGEIVFQYASELRLLDLETGESHAVKVLLPRDRRRIGPRNIEASKFISGWNLSADGEQAVVEARGDLWVVPVRAGSPRNLTSTSGAFERDPAWSPDGRWIAYFSDASGEYELYVLPADGKGEARQLTRLGPGFRSGPTWSPDARRIAFTDNTGAIYVHTVPSLDTKRVDKDPWAMPNRLSWSHDSSWLAYSKGGNNGLRAIWLYNVDAGQAHQATSGRFNDSWPTFDRRGDHLFFVSASDFSSPSFDSLDSTFVYGSTDSLLAVPLRHDGPSQPARPSEKLTIDLEGFEPRANRLPVATGRLWNLVVGHDGKLIYTYLKPGGEPSIQIFDPADPKQEAKVFLAEASGFKMSADGKKMLLRKGQTLALADAVADQKIAQPISLTNMVAVIDLRAEWRQIFTDVWRLYRDFFYDPNMHRVDWPAMRQRYATMLEHCACREDVNYIIAQMIAELSVSHARVANPGDVERAPGTSLGMLGADFELNEGAYRIAKIYTGVPGDAGSWSPLSQSGIDVKEGDYLLAVNKVPLNTRNGPWAAFQGLAGRPVTITVSKRPVLDRVAREIVVTPLGSETELRYEAGVEKNRAYVEQKTGGKVGYISLPNFGRDGLNDFVRQYYGQIDKQALIIDQRWNTGGPDPDRFLELLNRPVLHYWARRHGADRPMPTRGHRGPKCMIINGAAGSTGDVFPYLFRKAGFGKLIGTRTWGGVIGQFGGVPSLIDGGSVTIPNHAFYQTDGTWGIEGHGVAPDIEVADDAAAMVNGGDPQLDAAIELMLEEIKLRPYRPPPRAPYLDRTGVGIRQEDK